MEKVYVTQLKDMGGDWELLNTKWRMKLNSDNFMIKNTLEENTLMNVIMNSGILRTRGKIMNIIVKYIKEMPQGEFVDLIEAYRISSDNREYIGDWDPYNIHNKRDFIKQIKVSDFTLHGDDVTLSLLSRVLKVDFIIFGSDYSITPHGITSHGSTKLLYDGNEKIILVYYDMEKRYYRVMGIRKLGGRMNGKIDILISRMKMPVDLGSILDKNEFYLGHIKSICEEKVCKRVVLSDLIRELENRVQMTLSIEDRKSVIRMIREWLHDEMYFKKGSKLNERHMNLE